MRRPWEQITGYFGSPARTGGGLHPEFGEIPEWMFYVLPKCTLRFEIAANQVTHINVGKIPNADTPWWDRVSI
jgi:hypothetical protein